MHIEYEEFETVEEILLYMASVAPPMKNMMPINSYKGYVFSIIPLTPNTGESYLMIYTKGELNGTLLEFEMNTMKYKTVESAERADRTYFVALRPKRNTLADSCLKDL